MISCSIYLQPQESPYNNGIEVRVNMMGESRDQTLAQLSKTFLFLFFFFCNWYWCGMKHTETANSRHLFPVASTHIRLNLRDDTVFTRVPRGEAAAADERKSEIEHKGVWLRVWDASRVSGGPCGALVAFTHANGETTGSEPLWGANKRVWEKHHDGQNRRGCACHNFICIKHNKSKGLASAGGSKSFRQAPQKLAQEHSRPVRLSATSISDVEDQSDVAGSSRMLRDTCSAVTSQAAITTDDWKGKDCALRSGWVVAWQP